MVELLYRADTINFSVVGTINVGNALPLLAGNVSIDGPGPDLVTVRRDTGGNYSIFTVTRDVMVNISGLTISNGSDGRGGGIFNSGTLALRHSVVTGNSGAGIYNNGMNGRATLTISDSTISGNSGDGILNGGTVTISNSTVSGNSGSGIDNEFSVMTTVSNSTIAGNTATFGGGILSYAGGLTTVTNSTIAGNNANYGGGISLISGSMVARNTIIAGNTAPSGYPDVLGNIGSQGHNLIGNTQGASGWVDTDLLNVDPLLGALQNNGGPTQTMALLPGSPAIDAGDNTGAPMWDQRGPGFPRIEHGVIDIGAFEYHFPRQVQLVPVPVEAMPSVNGLSFGIPTLPAELPPLSVPGIANGQAQQRASLALATTAADLPVPRTFCHTFAGTGQPADPVGQSDAADLDLALPQQWRI
jgi:hypothetical protein